MFEAAPELPAEFAADLAAALGTFDILTPLSFSFCGEPPVDVGAAAMGPGWLGASIAAPVDPTAADLLAQAIQATLYDRCYAHRLGETRGQPDAAMVEDAAFGRHLVEANSGRERWDPGWVIYQFGANGQVFVRKGERERAAMPGAFISDTLPGQAPQIGTSVRLRAPREATGLQPGYYFAFGETLDEIADQLSLVRFYFHCAAEKAAPLLAALSPALNRFQVPFQAKAPASAALYDRTDAAVLYVAARYFAITARIVAELCERVSLAPSVPLFTKRLWPGVGVAADPGGGESFGSHRCRLTAEGIVDAWREGKQDVPARLSSVARRFSAVGLDLTRPHLGPGCVDLFLAPAPTSLP
ncbi:MAG TPA: T3SS effector HopA1 family protein [Xanthobacteraceae bacterium]